METNYEIWCEGEFCGMFPTKAEAMAEALEIADGRDRRVTVEPERTKGRKLRASGLVPGREITTVDPPPTIARLRQKIDWDREAKERQINEAGASLIRSVERALQNVARQSVNGLGELQSAATIFEAHIGAYHALCQVLREFPPEEESTPPEAEKPAAEGRAQDKI